MKSTANLRPLAAQERITVDITPFTRLVKEIFLEKGYVIESNPIDAGTRCFVYKATEISTGRTVAVKIATPFILSPDLCLAYSWAMESNVRFWRSRNIFNHRFSALIQLYDAGFIRAREMRRRADALGVMLPLMNREYESTGNYHYQILEFFDGSRSIKRLLDENFFRGKDTPVLIKAFAAFVNGIGEMHRAGIAHGELNTSNILINEAMAVKACDLDPLDIVTAKRENDCMFLRWAIFWVLRQASIETSYAGIIDDFFSTWDVEQVMRRGLPDFSRALMQLRERILAAGPRLDGVRPIAESDI